MDYRVALLGESFRIIQGVLFGLLAAVVILGLALAHAQVKSTKLALALKRSRWRSSRRHRRLLQVRETARDFRGQVSALKNEANRLAAIRAKSERRLIIQNAVVDQLNRDLRQVELKASAPMLLDVVEEPVDLELP